MALSSLANKALFAGNGVTTAWPFSFPILDAAHLSVIYTDAAGAESVLTPGAYGVAGIGSPAGGSVTYPLSGSPIASGTMLTLLRTVPYAQTTVLSNQGGYYPEVLERRLDEIYMGLQQLAEERARSVTGPVHENASDLELPDAARRADRILAFDAGGNLTVSTATLATIESPGASAASAAVSAAAAVTSATAAANAAAALVGTSTTSVAVGTGAKTFATQAGRQFFAGEFLLVVATVSPTNYMLGQVTAYNGATGQLDIAVTAAGGSGTIAAWTIAPSGAAGINGAAGASGIGFPGGRLTLTSGAPVLIANVAGAATIYYTPYNGSQVPLYDGVSAFAMASFTELSNLTTASSTGKAGPAAVAANGNYDLFVWNNGGTLTLTRGPAWTGDTARGTGAGTSELQRVLGIWTNKVAITNGPGAGLGTYVGTVRSNAGAQVDWNTGGISSGGSAALLCVWNAYNRVDVRGMVGDSTDSWAYTTATVRAANASTAMRASYIQGLQEDSFEASYQAMYSSLGDSAFAGIGFNSTSAFSGRRWGLSDSGGATCYTAGDCRMQALGWNYMNACECAAGASTDNWYGDAGAPGLVQTGLSYSGRF